MENTSQSKPNDTGIKSMGKMSHSALNATEKNNRVKNMPKSLIENAKYASWKESHTFDNCKLNRKDYGHFLANYLIGEKDGFVLNLNGSWGTGKTEFFQTLLCRINGARSSNYLYRCMGK